MQAKSAAAQAIAKHVVGWHLDAVRDYAERRGLSVPNGEDVTFLTELYLWDGVREVPVYYERVDGLGIGFLRPVGCGFDP